jgi:hypothetical protein
VKRVVLLLTLATLAVAAVPAHGATRCGTVDRPYTDGGAEVVITKGKLRCSTARGLMRRYWGIRADAFQTIVSLRHAGISWRCRPTVDDFPYRWTCTGGGPSRNRFRVTARE